MCMHEIASDGRQAAASPCRPLAVITMVVPRRTHTSPARSPTGSASANYRCSSPPPSSPSASPCRGCSSPSSPCSSAALMGLGYSIYGGRSGAERRRATEAERGRQGSRHPEPRQRTLRTVIAPIVVSSIVVATGGYFLVFPIAIAAVTIGAVVILFIKKVK